MVYGNAGDAIVKFSGNLRTPDQDLSVFVVTPGRPSATIEKCPPPGPPAPWLPTWDPAPLDEPIYVTNFDTGYTVQFDSHGTGKVVALAPKYTEGTALDPLGRVIATTRFSNEVTRLDPKTCKLEAIDYDLFTAEAPTYDRAGNLYVVDTNHHYVWKYTWPQYPRQIPSLIWRMPGFLEDLKVAPPNSPFAGNIFVLYRDRSKDVDDSRVCVFAPCPLTGNPNAIGMLAPSENPKLRGWKRIDDFANFGPSGNDSAGHCTGFQSLGMDFLPDGRLLVGDTCGTGVIRAYEPDGSGFSIFATVPQSASGVLTLTKLAVSASGQVYVTVNNSYCGPGENSASSLYRFDSSGRPLNPPFTQHLSCAVGIAVPTDLPIPPKLPTVPPVVGKLPPPVLAAPLVPIRAAVAPPMPPLPPPPLPVGAPAPGPAPIPEIAQAPAPNPAPAPAAHPMAAAVPQQQEQPQMAFVLAANQVREQVSEEYAMSEVNRPADPLLTARFALISGALMLVAAYGYVSLALSRARSHVRVDDRY